MPHGDSKPRLAETSFRYRGEQVTLRGIPGDLITKRIIDHGTFYEAPLLEEIARRNLRGIYIDVGAHIGNHTVFFARFCPSTEVWAFEPQVAPYTALTQNTREIEKVWRNWHAVHTAERVALVPPAPGNSGTGRVEPATGPRSMEARRLDELLLSRSGRVAVLKIDVEGAEAAVLDTAKNLLQVDHPLVVVEAHDDARRIDVEARLPEGYRHDGVYCATPTHLYVWERPAGKLVA